MLNINSGVLRHVIEWYEQPEGTDDYGNPVDRAKVYETTWANVRVASGSQSAAFGIKTTDEAITVMVWYDPRITNDLFIVWDSKTYEILHIKPDELRKGMIITARLEIT